MWQTFTTDGHPLVKSLVIQSMVELEKLNKKTLTMAIAGKTLVFHSDDQWTADMKANFEVLLNLRSCVGKYLMPTVVFYDCKPKTFKWLTVGELATLPDDFTLS